MHRMFEQTWKYVLWFSEVDSKTLVFFINYFFSILLLLIILHQNTKKLELG
jgi:hypothetical protein